MRNILKTLLFQFFFIVLIPDGLTQGDYLFEEEVNYNQKWVRLYKTEKKSIQKLLEILKKSEIGQKIISLAKKKSSLLKSRLDDLIKGGRVSLTDTTLVRKFSPLSPEKLYVSTKSKIYLDRSLNVIDALLDLSHELTHFASRDHFNPYKKSFSLKTFIVEMIEGKGGEVEAYLVECRVYKELFPKYFYKKSNCLKIYNQETGRFSRERGVIKFYQIGSHLRVFQKEIERLNVDSKDFPYLNSRPSYFISSSYGLPYPVAAVKEYLSIIKKVCQNDLKRLQFFQKNLNKHSTLRNDYEEKNKFNNIRDSILSRCQKYL